MKLPRPIKSRLPLTLGSGNVVESITEHEGSLCIGSFLPELYCDGGQESFTRERLKALESITPLALWLPSIDCESLENEMSRSPLRRC
jgi:hypothetical protein